MKYTVTFTIETESAEDPGLILEASEMMVDDLIAHLESVGIEATHTDDGTSPSVSEQED